MNEYRQQLHEAYKKKMCDIILHFLRSLDEDIEEFEISPELYVESWVDAHFVPVGDCSKEDIIKQIDEWQKGSNPQGSLTPEPMCSACK